MIQFDPPFVVFLGDVTDDIYARTGLGLVQWREGCLGQVRLPGSTVDAGVPDLTIAQAMSAGVRSLVLGVAAVGGGIPGHWLPTLCEAAAAGIDIVAGVHVRLASLPGLAEAARRCHMINNKLDKTGGLTHALELARAARARGLGLMVGCMAGSSLAMAPAVMLGWLCDLVDVDGPLLRKRDRLDGIRYDRGQVSIFAPELWG